MWFGWCSQWRLAPKTETLEILHRNASNIEWKRQGFVRFVEDMHRRSHTTKFRNKFYDSVQNFSVSAWSNINDMTRVMFFNIFFSHINNDTWNIRIHIELWQMSKNLGRNFDMPKNIGHDGLILKGKKSRFRSLQKCARHSLRDFGIL